MSVVILDNESIIECFFLNLNYIKERDLFIFNSFTNLTFPIFSSNFSVQLVRAIGL